MSSFFPPFIVLKCRWRLTLSWIFHWIHERGYQNTQKKKYIIRRVSLHKTQLDSNRKSQNNDKVFFIYLFFFFFKDTRYMSGYFVMWVLTKQLSIVSRLSEDAFHKLRLQAICEIMGRIDIPMPCLVLIIGLNSGFYWNWRNVSLRARMLTCLHW